MTKEEIDELYRELIRRALTAGCDFMESDGEGVVTPGSRYFYKISAGNGPLCRPQIVIYRDSSWFSNGIQHESYGPETCVEKIDRLIQRGRGLEEVIAVAHELGHHLCPNPDIQPIVTFAFANKCVSSEEDKEKIISDERSAWSKAREILQDLGFNEWEQFTKQSETAVATYLTISICPKNGTHSSTSKS